MLLVVQTKFDVGQRVWSVLRDRVEEHTIDSVSSYGENTDSSQWVSYYITIGGVSTVVAEHNLYATKAEAQSAYEVDQLKQQLVDLEEIVLNIGIFNRKYKKVINRHENVALAVAALKDVHQKIKMLCNL